MASDQPPPQQGVLVDATALQGVVTELNVLRDLFQRRLLEDKAKTRLYDELYAQVGFARAELARTYLKPLYGELLLVIDRLRRMVDDELAASVVIELEEVLERRGVRRINTTTQFNPKVHEAVRTKAHDEVPCGQIVAVLREGYRLEHEVLRPAAVVVSAGQAAPNSPKPQAVRPV